MLELDKTPLNGITGWLPEDVSPTHRIKIKKYTRTTYSYGVVISNQHYYVEKLKQK